MKNDRAQELKLPLNAIKVLERRYFKKDNARRVIETPLQLFRRVAKAVSLAEGNFKERKIKREETEDKFFSMMRSLEFMPNSPTLMNAGTKMGQLSACFVLPVEDSIPKIFSTLRDMATIHQTGGGTGFDFSRLRPKGDLVYSTKGEASGPVSFMSIFDTATGVIVQGGRRRGANMGILRVDHPDIVEFIEAKLKEGRFSNFNLSVAATDEFMRSFYKNTKFGLVNPRTGIETRKVKAREIFELIINSAWRSGDPGLVFVDEINRRNPTPGVGKIEATNPCVDGNSLVSTDKGLMRIDELSKGVHTNILADNRASLGKEGLSLNKLTKAWSTGMKDTFKLITKSGYELVATAGHQIMTDTGWVALKDIVLGKHAVLIQSGEGRWNRDRQLPFETKNNFKGKNGRKYIFNFPDKWSQELGEVLGWLIGDGFLYESSKDCRIGFVFSKTEKRLLRYYKRILTKWYKKDIRIRQGQNGCLYLSYHSKFLIDFFKQIGVGPVKAENKRVPSSLFTAPQDAVSGFLRGIFSADGTVNYVEDKSSYVRLTSKSKEIIKGVQLLLLNFGIVSRVYNRSRAKRLLFPYTTVKGEKKIYESDGLLFELEISKDMVLRFIDKIGFLGGLNKDKLKKFYQKDFYKTYFKDMAVKIEPAGRRLVYDLNEPATNSFIANGIVVHNCGELPLLPYESCNLASLNLSKFATDRKKLDWEKLADRIRWGVRFLDNVIEVNKFPLSQIGEITFNNRKIGLGVMGFADMLILLGIPYNSREAVKFASRLMRFIRRESLKASEAIAKTRGSFPNFKKSVYARRNIKIRNATVNTIAPTGTISIIAGCSSGIEPLFAISFTRNVLSGTRLFEINPLFERLAKERRFYSEEMMMEIARRGSIQDIAGIPNDIKKIFITAFDVTAVEHLCIQAAFQRYTDNSVSKTVNLAAEATVEDVKKIYLLAHKLKCKGITIYRYGTKKEQVLSFSEQPGSAEKIINVAAEYSGGCASAVCA